MKGPHTISPFLPAQAFLARFSRALVLVRWTYRPRSGRWRCLIDRPASRWWGLGVIEVCPAGALADYHAGPCARPLHASVHPVEHIECRQADIGNFLFAESNLVTYPRGARQRMLALWQRGLLRSPASTTTRLLPKPVLPPPSFGAFALRTTCKDLTFMGVVQQACSSDRR